MSVVVGGSANGFMSWSCGRSRRETKSEPLERTAMFSTQVPLANWYVVMNGWAVEDTVEGSIMKVRRVRMAVEMVEKCMVAIWSLGTEVAGISNKQLDGSSLSWDLSTYISHTVSSSAKASASHRSSPYLHITVSTYQVVY